MADFSFADFAREFDDHIRRSIPSYETLVDRCCNLAPRYAATGSTVADVGCTTGRFLSLIRRAVRANRAGVTFLGVDIEPAFEPKWKRRRAVDTIFLVEDALACMQMTDLSFVTCLFTLQFMQAPVKLDLLERLYNGLRPGCALVIGEKVYAETGRMQEALTFSYYDRKLMAGFTHQEILDKEKGLRGVMYPWTATELTDALARVGFREIQTIWSDFPFIGILALKPSLSEK